MSFLSLTFKSSFPRPLTRGFTIAEMITVVAIITVMTGVVLANFPEFRDRSSLELVAQEVSLVIRQAQSFGANTRGGSFSSSFAFPSYGIYFNPGDGGQVGPGQGTPSPNAFVLFGDSNKSGSFSDSGANPPACASANSECREVYRLGGGISISRMQLCASSVSCSTTDPTHLNIVFTRPNPEARFSSNTASLDNSCNGACSYAKITLLLSKSNVARNICVWSTGHIYVTAEFPAASPLSC